MKTRGARFKNSSVEGKLLKKKQPRLNKFQSSPRFSLSIDISFLGSSLLAHCVEISIFARSSLSTTGAFDQSIRRRRRGHVLQSRPPPEPSFFLASIICCNLFSNLLSLSHTNSPDLRIVLAPFASFGQAVVFPSGRRPFSSHVVGLTTLTNAHRLQSTLTQQPSYYSFQ